MTKELSVDEQALKRKTRHRLLGAAALTLIAIVALPMLLDNEPKPAGQNISLDIPSAEKISEFSPPVPAENVAPAPETPAAEPTATHNNNVEESAPNSPRHNTQSAEQSPIRPKPSENKPNTKSPVVVIPPINSRAVRADSKHYLLHIGNYSNPTKAVQVAEKLKQNNLNVTIEKSNNKTRIHVGPFADREQADKARQLLQKQGTRSTLITTK